MTDEMKIVAKGILCCLIIAALFIACSESITNPATPGSGLFTRNVVIKNDTLYPTTDTTFLQRVATDAFLFSPLQANWIGKNGNYTAYTALRFYPLVRDTINVLSAKLTLRLVTWRGDSSGTFAFTVHKILNTWDQTTLKWPTADSTGFYETTPRGNPYSASLGPDTQKITINLDTAMVREWYRSGVTSFGFLLKPAPGCTIMRGIHAFDFDSTGFWPQLEVIARGTSTTISDTTRLQVGADTYVAEVSPFNLSPDHLFTQAGIAYHAKMKFDFSRIPRGSIVNSAELLLEKDPALTKINKFTKNSQPEVYTLVSTDSSVFESPGALGDVKSGNTYKFDVRRAAQLWVNGTNYGLLLRQPDTNELSTLDVFAFYSKEAANPAQRPRILVTYTVFE